MSGKRDEWWEERGAWQWRRTPRRLVEEEGVEGEGYGRRRCGVMIVGLHPLAAAAMMQQAAAYSERL